MTKSILMVLTNTSITKNGKKTGVWFEEFAVPYTRFLKEKYTITVATPVGDNSPIDPASCYFAETGDYKSAEEGINNVKKLDTLSAEDYDSIVLPGGHGPMFDLAKDLTLAKMLESFAKKNKLIAAVCHGPAGLLRACVNGTPLVAGRRITCFTNEEESVNHKEDILPFYLEDRLKELDAKFIKKSPGEINIIEDNNLITGQNSQSSEAFAEAIVNWLSK